MQNSTATNITRRRAPRFELIAGSVCLDFANTLDDRFTSQPKELLKDYIDLARFGEDTGIMEATRVDRLFAWSQQNPEAAKKVLESGIRLREAIFAVVWAVVAKKPVPRAALYTLNGFIQLAAEHSSLVESRGRFEWQFDDAANNLEAPLWPIARSAADLLASEELEYVRACAAETCKWFFLDTSKNHGRVWCDMKKCGNRAKFRAFYRRRKKPN